MKKLFFYCVIVFFITSCASFKYSKNYENTFNLTSNVDHVIVSNKSGNLRANKTSSSYQNHNYEIYLDKINNKYLSLQVTKNNYDTAYLELKKTPRFGAIARDFFIGIPTFFTPFLIDAFRSDFYQISSNSKHQEVRLKYHQEFMKKEFKKIEKSTNPSDFVDYISNYPHSNFVNQATDKKDASELVIAVNKASESEIDNYILSHQNSSSLNEAKKIKAEIVEARIAFQGATNLNSVSAYEQFLAKYPKSIPHKEAHIKLIDAAEKVALSSNNLKQMLAYYDNYLQNFKNFIGEETYKSKNAIISKTIDNQIVLENNPKQLWNYNEYSKLWITYIEVSTKYKNKLLTLDISKAYDLKISSELFALLIKISDANKHAEFLQKASADFPELSTTKELFLITILQKSSNKNGNLKLFNQAYVPYLISKNKLYDVTSFNYKNNQYQSIEGSTYEELTFKNNEIQEIKVFKDNNLQTQLKFSSGYSNMNEASYFINGKLVLTDFMQFASKLYSYEFEDGVNLSLKQLENKIKEGDAALASKNFDMALEIYSECSNDYPPTIELNKRLENSRNNAENKKEKERIANKEINEKAQANDPENGVMKYKGYIENKVIEMVGLEDEALEKEHEVMINYLETKLNRGLNKYDEEVLVKIGTEVIKKMKTALNLVVEAYSNRGNSESNSSSNSREGSNTGSSKCTWCNQKFKFLRWREVGSGGWEDVEETKYGWIKCKSCEGYGVTYKLGGQGSFERCYMSCNNGWEKCTHSSHRNE